LGADAKGEISGKFFDAVHLHPATNPAQDGAPFVARKIMPGAHSEKGERFAQSVLIIGLLGS
jgi:hypothetical protein